MIIRNKHYSYLLVFDIINFTSLKIKTIKGKLINKTFSKKKKKKAEDQEHRREEQKRTMIFSWKNIGKNERKLNKYLVLMIINCINYKKERIFSQKL